jgi:hypothetical protein
LEHIPGDSIFIKDTLKNELLKCIELSQSKKSSQNNTSEVNFERLMNVLDPRLQSVLNLDWVEEEIQKNDEGVNALLNMSIVHSFFDFEDIKKTNDKTKDDVRNLIRSIRAKSKEFLRKKEPISTITKCYLNRFQMWEKGFSLRALTHIKNHLISNSSKPPVSMNIISFAFSEWVYENELSTDFFDDQWLNSRKFELKKLIEGKLKSVKFFFFDIRYIVHSLQIQSLTFVKAMST